MSLIDEFHQAKAKLAARSAEPWRLRLERVRGKIGDDGVERITTQLLFDILEVPQRSRGAGACRRLRSLWPNSGGWLCGSEGSHAAAIWSRCAGTAVMLGTGNPSIANQERPSASTAPV